MNTYEMFWTGGFDSTFRLVQLSRLPIRLQPVFITGIASDIRKSEKYELRAIKQIYELLSNKPTTKADLLPVKIVYNVRKPPHYFDSAFSYSVLPHDHSVARAFRSLYIAMIEPRHYQLATKRGVLNAVNIDTYLDSQYQWCASYANSQNNHIEIGITARYVKIFMDAIGSTDALVEINNEYFSTYILDQDKCISSDGYKIFGHFSYPFYNFLSKPELIKEYILMGCEDVMRKTWFCYDPIDDEPCGQCWTCLHTYRDGITDRFSPVALARYHKREAELKNEDISIPIKGTLP